MVDFVIKRTKTLIYTHVAQTNLKMAVAQGLIKNVNNVIKNLIQAVDYCHYNDIIHRDLKPDNILLRGNKVMLIDFGLSVPYATYHDYLDVDLAASPLYRAPEAYLGDVHYNHKIDIWALGLIFYFIVSGHELYDDDEVHHMFKLLGTPTKSTWNKALSLPHWNKYKKFQYKSHLTELKKELNGYYPLIKACLVLNPDKRAHAHDLLQNI